MNTTETEPRVQTESAAIRAWAEGRTVYVELHDGRIIGFPANRFRILSKATDEELARVRICRQRLISKRAATVLNLRGSGDSHPRSFLRTHMS
jgi:hypothetical protein